MCETLFLTFPEQNIRIPGSAIRDETALGQDSFALLGFEIICTRIRASTALSTFTAKNRPGLVQKKGERLSMKSKHVFAWDTLGKKTPGDDAEVTHHACRPSPKPNSSGDIVANWCLAAMISSPSFSRSFKNRNPSNSWAFGYISSS